MRCVAITPRRSRCQCTTGYLRSRSLSPRSAPMVSEWSAGRDGSTVEAERSWLSELRVLGSTHAREAQEMVKTVIVCYASAAGSTREVSERIAARLGANLRRLGGEEPARVVCEAATPELDIVRAETLVVGSAVHNMAWLPEALSLLQRVAGTSTPLWIFSVGGIEPAGPITRFVVAKERVALERAFPAGLTPRDHRVFRGIVLMTGLPWWAKMFWRVVGGRPGDHRDWSRVDQYADDIAAECADARPGGTATV